MIDDCLKSSWIDYVLSSVKDDHMIFNICNLNDVIISGCLTDSVRFVGGLGGFNPPLVEDDPHTGD